MDASTKSRSHHSHQDEEESHSYAIWLMGIGAVPKILEAAVQLGIFDIIAKAGPDAELTSAEIVAHLTTKNSEAPAMVERVLGVLATHGVVGCTVRDDTHRVYSLTAVARYFVRNEDGSSLRPFMDLVMDKTYLASLSHIKDAVLEGGVPFHKANGMHLYEYTSKNLMYNQVFNAAMSSLTTVFMKAIIDVYPGFQSSKQLVDVGGATGVTLRIIKSKYPSIKGTNFDLPHVIQHATPCHGIDHIGGNMFESVPHGDAILLKWVLHNWSDDECIKLLKNCYKAIPSHGKVIVVEAVVSVNPEMNLNEKITSILDAMMMIQAAGKERTQKEFVTLATKAGFSGIRFECCVSNNWIMEFFK